MRKRVALLLGITAVLSIGFLHWATRPVEEGSTPAQPPPIERPRTEEPQPSTETVVQDADSKLDWHLFVERIKTAEPTWSHPSYGEAHVTLENVRVLVRDFRWKADEQALTASIYDVGSPMIAAREFFRASEMMAYGYHDQEAPAATHTRFHGPKSGTEGSVLLRCGGIYARIDGDREQGKRLAAILRQFALEAPRKPE